MTCVEKDFKTEKAMFERNRNVLQKILLAANQSEYYHSVFLKANIDVEKIETYEDFSNIPMLDKETYSQKKYLMIAQPQTRERIIKKLSGVTDLRTRRQSCEECGIFLKVTSGSTGNPVEIIKDKRDLLREYMGLNYARKKNLGFLPKGKYIWIWPANERIRSYFYDDGEKHVYNDTKYGFKYMMPEYSETSFDNLYKFIIQNDISWITAPPSMLCLFAEYLQANCRRVQFTYIECHSEKMYEWQSCLIKNVFGSKPLSVYSSNEIQFMAMTDFSNIMYIIQQNVFLELVENDRGEKNVYATSLCAREIPIIRYSLGDIAHWKTDMDKNIKSPCIELCGYRSNDYIVLRDGRKFEPFVISDLIVLLNDRYHIEIGEFVAHQTGYEEFTFYFNRYVSDKIRKALEIQSYMKNYLNEILHINIEMKVQCIDQINRQRGTHKYKYFCGMIK